MKVMVFCRGAVRRTARAFTRSCPVAALSPPCLERLNRIHTAAPSPMKRKSTPAQLVEAGRSFGRRAWIFIVRTPSRLQRAASGP